MVSQSDTQPDHQKSKEEDMSIVIETILKVFEKSVCHRQ